MEGALTELRFRITDERSGKPVQGNRPAAWMDVGANIQGQAGAVQKQCIEKIGLYLKGAVGIRPLVDLNGYYLLVMNKDPSITVIDPMVSMAGRTSTFTSVTLKKPPMDWVNHGDLKRLYVSMPAAGQVAVVDTESFKVVSDIDCRRRSHPHRAPARRPLPVGGQQRAATPKDSGVTVIDTRDQKVVMKAATGRGHHEIAVSADNRHAFVTNRDDGTVTVFDVGTLKKVKDIKTGSLPLSIAWSSLSRAAYVADGKDGTIAVIDGGKLEVAKTIQAKPGLGPLRFTPDGRFAMVVNTAESVVHVIDPGSNEIIHSPKVQAEPFQVSYTPGLRLRAQPGQRAGDDDQPEFAGAGQGADRAELRRRQLRAEDGRRPAAGRRRDAGAGRGGRVRREPRRQRHLLLHGGHERPHVELRQPRQAMRGR